MIVTVPLLGTTRILFEITHSLACHPEDITLRLLGVSCATECLLANWSTGGGVLKEDYRDNRFADVPSACLSGYMLNEAQVGLSPFACLS